MYLIILLKYQCTPNDHNSSALLYGRLTRTLLKYVFSESLIIVDYEGLFANVKKIEVSQI